jgi:hypothetical protein
MRIRKEVEDYVRMYHDLTGHTSVAIPDDIYDALVEETKETLKKWGETSESRAYRGNFGCMYMLGDIKVFPRDAYLENHTFLMW